jgi:predicted dehydrogenase
MVRIGVVGYGYWGPNIVRNFSAVEGAEVVSVCDVNGDMLCRAVKAYPHITTTSDPVDICAAAGGIDAVAIVTPVFTHFDIAKMALENGKHVFVEKPFTFSSSQGEQLIEIAEKRNLKIMVDHTFLFTGSVRKMKQIIDDDMLGDLYYFDSTRVNLGLFQHDVNVIWDLAPHDLSIMNYLIKEQPVAVSATGVAHFDNNLEDLAYMTLYFPGNIIAHISVNWLSPVKVRRTLIGGHKKMLMWNDLNEEQKIVVYDKGVEVTNRESIYDLLVSYRSGDMWAPKVDKTEALRLEAEHFVRCINHDETPISDGRAGLQVVRILEAANKSLAKRGEVIEL